MQKLKQIERTPTTTSAEKSTNTGSDRNNLVSDLVACIQIFFLLVWKRMFRVFAPFHDPARAAPKALA